MRKEQEHVKKNDKHHQSGSSKVKTGDLFYHHNILYQFKNLTLSLGIKFDQFSALMLA